MPTDQLTTAPVFQLAGAVLSVLAGGSVPQAAARHGVDVDELDEAVRVYQAAGYGALERRAEREWFQVRIQFADWNAAEQIGARELLPRMARLERTGAIAGWWFLRKYPCWRIRVRAAASSDPGQLVPPALDELVATGHIERWWPTIYEPEIAAFGGGVGMNVVHALFCADSRGVLDFASRTAPGIGRRELSILLCSTMMCAANLDSFERGDVFDRVTRLRPPLTTAAASQVGKLAAAMRTLVNASAAPDSALFAQSGPAHFARPWLVAFETAGRTLGEAAANGQLERGVRAILTHILIFHWNRLGLSATRQGIVARAAALAALPRN